MDVMVRISVFVFYVMIVVIGLKMLNIVRFVKWIITEINLSYKKVVEDMGKGFNTILCIMGVLLVVYMFFYSYQLNHGKIGQSIITMVFTIMILYIICGIPLLLFEKAITLIVGMKDKQFSQMYSCSLFILVMTVFLKKFSLSNMFNNKVDQYIFAVGAITVYFLNLKILWRFFCKPQLVEVSDDTNYGALASKRYFTVLAATLLFILNVFDFSLMVWLMSECVPCAYNQESIGLFQSLYYVIISFTTIGYGDIYPTHILGQLLSMIVSVTSVVYLVIFVNFITGYITSATLNGRTISKQIDDKKQEYETNTNQIRSIKSDSDGR